MNRCPSCSGNARHVVLAPSSWLRGLLGAQQSQARMRVGVGFNAVPCEACDATGVQYRELPAAEFFELEPHPALITSAQSPSVTGAL